MVVGPQTVGKDFNYFTEVTVATTDLAFPNSPQAMSAFRGPRRMIFVCTCGSIQYSFNGIAVHGTMELGASNQYFDFGTRGEDKVWVRWTPGSDVQGPGIIQIQMWHQGL